MNTRFKWTLLSLAIPALIACGGSDSDSGTDASATAQTNQGPTAIAGQDQNVSYNSQVTLDASSSLDSKGELISYSWTLATKPDGSAAALSDSNSISPQFTADTAGTYVASLVVNNGTQDSAPVEVTITAAGDGENSAPTVYAGDDLTVSLGGNIQITADAADADNNPLTYQWTIEQQAENSTPTLANDQATTVTLNAATEGSYVLRVVVSDGQATAEDTITIKLDSGNVPPIAVAGDDVAVGVTDQVNLDASASSDGNNDALTYTWQFVSKPENSNAELNTANAATPNFIADLSGDYVLSLTVSDGEFTSQASNIKVTAKNQLKLVFNGDPSQNTWPYVLDLETINKIYDDPKPAEHKFASFTIQALGQDYTVREVTPWGINGIVQPTITGVVEGQVIKAGETVEVEFASPLTGGEMEFISLSVIFAEDNDYYVNASYMFTTN